MVPIFGRFCRNHFFYLQKGVEKDPCQRCSATPVKKPNNSHPFDDKHIVLQFHANNSLDDNENWWVTGGMDGDTTRTTLMYHAENGTYSPFVDIPGALEWNDHYMFSIDDDHMVFIRKQGDAELLYQRLKNKTNLMQ